MTNPERFLVPGPDQDLVLDGIIKGHSYAKHVDEFGGPDRVSPTDFRAIAERSIGSANTAYAVTQGTAENVVWGSTAEGTAGWINTSNPYKSTLFKPPDGPDDFLRVHKEGQPEHLLRELDLPTIRQEDPKPPTPDEVEQEHEAPVPPAPAADPASAPAPSLAVVTDQTAGAAGDAPEPPTPAPLSPAAPAPPAPPPPDPAPPEPPATAPPEPTPPQPPTPGLPG